MADRKHVLRAITGAALPVAAFGARPRADPTLPGGRRGGSEHVVSGAAARFDSPQELFGDRRDLVAQRAE